VDRTEDRFGPAVGRILDADTGNGDVQRAGTTEAPSSTIADQPTIPATRLAVTDAKAAAGERAAEASPIPSLLTNAERETFREIARSLAALTGKEPELPPSRIDPDAAARRGIRPLEVLKQDRISRTGHQPAPAPDQPASPSVSDTVPPSPVVPFGELQARRNLRAKPDNAPGIPLSALDKIPVGLFVMQQGKPVFANRAFLDMCGHPDLESFIGAGGINQLFDARATESGSDVRHMTIVTRNGERIPVEATFEAMTINDAAATLTSVRGRQDVARAAEHRALELDLLLARSELGELRSVLDTATDGVILLDGQGRILSLNRSAEALFGFDQNEIAGENLTVLLEPESHLAALDYLEGLKSNGVHSIMNDGRDVKGRERNGGAIPLSMTIGRIGDSKDRQKFCAVLRDITHWKKVEADLLEAKRAAEDSSANKTDFLARISHEIRTPLNAVIGFSQVMMNEDFGPIGNDRYKQYARDINASGAHIVSLVNDLLDLAKVASGRLDLNFASVDVNALVAACVGMIQPQANAGRVIVRSQLASHMPPVVADERSVRQILLNLLSNAAKFTEAGGQVVASTSLSERGEVIIRVRDTGIGMAPEDVRRALEPFRQIPGPRASGGTGLGLPLTKALVEANRAGFAIESEPGRGTLVEVTFPATRVLAE
jgi:PAS domain S-box-containing protein